MKKYFFALALVLSVGAHAFEVSGNHFEGKFKIDSMTVGENEVTVNASSAAADVGQYGKVYVSYTFTQNPYIPNSGTWKGHGRGMSPDGQLQAGILMGVWTRDGSVFNMKSVDSVTDGINYVQGTMDVLTGDINLEIYPVI